MRSETRVPCDWLAVRPYYSYTDLKWHSHMMHICSPKLAVLFFDAYACLGLVEVAAGVVRRPLRSAPPAAAPLINALRLEVAASSTLNCTLILCAGICLISFKRQPLPPPPVGSRAAPPPRLPFLALLLHELIPGTRPSPHRT